MKRTRMKVIRPFSDTRIIENIQDLTSGKSLLDYEWVNGLVQPGDIIDVVAIKHCGCGSASCDSSIVFTIPDLPEVEMLEGSMYFANDGLLEQK